MIYSHVSESGNVEEGWAEVALQRGMNGGGTEVNWTGCNRRADIGRQPRNRGGCHGVRPLLISSSFPLLDMSLRVNYY